jgi:hypothetical protein
LAGIPVHAARIDGIRGAGHVLGAVFLRGHARVSGAMAIACHELPVRECLSQLASAIELPVPR